MLRVYWRYGTSDNGKAIGRDGNSIVVLDDETVSTGIGDIPVAVSDFTASGVSELRSRGAEPDQNAGRVHALPDHG